jgi:hypothetical protein
MAESTANARQEVENSRRAVESELDELGAAARAAVDIPAKVRRNPVKVAGLASGAAFLAVGGPKRVLRAAERRFWPSRKQRVQKVLPDEVARVVNRLGEDADAVRDHLERDFMGYLAKRHPEEIPNVRRSAWRTYDTLIGPIGAAAASFLVKKLFETPPERKPEDRQATERQPDEPPPPRR